MTLHARNQAGYKWSLLYIYNQRVFFGFLSLSPFANASPIFNASTFLTNYIHNMKCKVIKTKY